MECPPPIAIPTLAQISRAPRNTSAATEFGNLSVGQPKILKAITGVPPMAYTSLIEFAAAILPKSYGLSTMGVKKSVVLTKYWSFPISQIAASSPREFPTTNPNSLEEY